VPSPCYCNCASAYFRGVGVLHFAGSLKPHSLCDLNVTSLKNLAVSEDRSAMQHDILSDIVYHRHLQPHPSLLHGAVLGILTIGM
jgi:hypothetical protein